LLPPSYSACNLPLPVVKPVEFSCSLPTSKGFRVYETVSRCESILLGCVANFHLNHHFPASSATPGHRLEESHHRDAPHSSNGVPKAVNPANGFPAVVSWPVLRFGRGRT